MAKKIRYYKHMEDMKGKELEERIRFGKDFNIPHEIEPVPFLGEEDQITEYVFDELVARCPVTGIKDHYKITIRFIPHLLIPELKSLKLYLWDYEECKVPISHEHLADKIFRYFKKILSPKDIFLRLEVAGRGELFTTIRLGNLELDRFKEREFKNL
jgi:NADPH-dependent 7-cyano-7-deazaguanine reductase QueF